LFIPQVKDKTSNIFSWFAVYNFFSWNSDDRQSGIQSNDLIRSYQLAFYVTVF
jgi:hypothetical protein